MLTWQNEDYEYLKNHTSERISILHGSDFENRYNVFNIFASNQFKDRFILIKGIESSKETPYLPFINLFSGEQINFFKKLGRAFLKDITKSETSGVIYDKLTNNRRDCDFLDNRIIGILSILNNAAKKNSLALAITNFEEFDENSVELVKLIILGKLKNVFQYLTNIKMYFLCETEDCPDCYDSVKKNSHIEYYLKSPSENDVKEFLKTYYPQLNISTSDFHRFYHFCGGKLTYCEILAEYFIKNNRIEFFDSTDMDLIFNILSNRLYSMGNIGDRISYALKLASEIGEEFSSEILANALNAEDNMKSIVKNAKNEYLIKHICENRYKFYYPIIWSYFINQATKTLKINDYILLERAIYSYNAKDYITRGIFLKRAGRVQDAAEMYLLEYCNHLVGGVKISKKFKSDVQCACDEAKLGWLLSSLESYAEAMNAKSFYKATTIFDNGCYNTQRLQIIKYMFTGYAIYRSASSNQDLAVALGKINNATELAYNFEMGLWSDCASLLMAFELNINGNLIKAIEWHDKLTDYYELSNNEEAKVQLNILKRKSAVICSVERAFVKTEECVKFFKNSYYLSEYVMALNNCAANAMLLGKLDIAYNNISEAKNIVDNMPFCVANTNYILSNYCTVNVLRDYSMCEQSARLLFESLSGYEDASWKIIPLINCAIFYALQGKYDDSEALLSKAHSMNSEVNDDYYKYYIEINRASLYYLKNDINKAVTILQKYTDSNNLPKLFKTSEKVYLKKRAESWISIMKTKKITNPIKFNDFLRNKKIGGNQWDVISRGFLVSDIQYWSDT